jgi:predicted DNA-binding protein
MRKIPKQPTTGEAKDVTCAVRFNATMYERLKATAGELGLSLSDIIRQSLTAYMDTHSRTVLEKKLEEVELRKKVIDATKNQDQSLKDTLLQLLEKTGS